MNFNFVGYLRPIKDTDDRKNFEVRHYDSGWMSERIRFRIVAGDNTHFVEANGGRWEQENKNIIYTYEKVEGNNKGNPVQIPWSKRNDPSVVDKIVGWRVLTVDTDTYRHRKGLEEAGDDAGLEASNKKRKHFIANTDFVEYVNKLVNSDKIADWKFRVTGNVNYSYSAKNDRYYSAYEVTKIYRVDDSTPVTSEVDVDFFFSAGAIDSSAFEETQKAIINGYTTFYDSSTKRNWFAPITLVARDKIKAWEKIFNKCEDESVRKIGLVCQNINGAQRQNIRLEDLDEETQENVALGLISEQDAIRDAGGQMFGDRVQELRIESLGRGYSKGSEETVYTVEDLTKKPMMEQDVIEDLFSDDEDDL